MIQLSKLVMQVPKTPLMTKLRYHQSSTINFSKIL